MKKTKDTSPTIEDMVRAARKAGGSVSFTIKPPCQMPFRCDSDHPIVKMLIAESERNSAAGNRWLDAQVPNHIAATACHQAGWAHSLSAAWLRCKLKGELLPESDDVKAAGDVPRLVQELVVTRARVTTCLETLDKIGSAGGSVSKRMMRDLARSAATFLRECESERKKRGI